MLSRINTWRHRRAAVVLLSLVRPDAVAAQKSTNLSGFTQDQLEHRIVGATVAATHTRTGVKYQAKTDRSGTFEFIGIPAGDYALEARFSGFSTFVDVVSMGGAEVQRTITLELAMLEETVTVTDKDVTPTISERTGEVLPRPGEVANERCSQPAAGGCIEPPVSIRHVRPPYVGIDGKVVL